MASLSTDAGPAAPPGPPPAWIRLGAATAAAGYTLLAVAVQYTEAGGASHARQSIAAALTILGLVISARRPRLAAVLVLAVVWLELTYSFYERGQVLSVNAIAYPALVVAAGLFSGGGAALATGLLCAVTLPLVVHASGAWRAGLPPQDVRALIVEEVLLVGLGLLTRSAMHAYRGQVARSERDRQRYLALFEHAADGLVALDDTDRITEVNAISERLLDAAREWLRGVRFEDALRSAGAEPGFDLDAAREGAPVPVTLRRPGGQTRMLEISARTRFGEGEAAGALRVVRDVTERRQLDERLGHAQRLETVGGLAGGVAHDFNNLLTVMGGNAALLQEHRDPAVRELGGGIAEAHRRGVALTRQLLAFARREVRRPEPLELGEAVEGLRRLLERMLGEQHKLVLDRAAPAPVMADRAQLEQVVVNLVANARDAMPAGGPVTLRIQALPAARAAGLGSTLAAPEQALLEVSDEGVGMSSEVRSRIFEPFFTTKPRGQGTGLGLAAVHGIVAQSGGAVTVESSPGRGACFRIFLPRAAAQVQRPAPAGPVAPRGGSEAVLLVEDDPGVRALARRVLDGAGYHVTEAANGAAGLAAAETMPDLRMVVTDVVMPGLSGPALVEQLRRRQPGVAVLYVSGYAGGGRAAAQGLDPADLLPKPFQPEELLARVRSALDAPRPHRG
ncbi:MAG: ATP-binding protein [Anaeromyxobacter sp.]